MAARVVLAMSGGVDSSVAATCCASRATTLSACSCTGDHGRDDGRADHKKGCCSAVDAGDARRVADRLDIPFYALDFEKDFDRIIDYFADEYLTGRTPNPCVVCNSWLKFGQLWTYGQQLEADFIATGHYARTVAAATRSNCTAAPIRTKISPTFFTAFSVPSCRACYFLSAISVKRKYAAWRGRPG